jgi:peptidoglycan hydrolase-like protein with peptidoglycan-binding domain
VDRSASAPAAAAGAREGRIGRQPKAGGQAVAERKNLRHSLRGRRVADGELDDDLTPETVGAIAEFQRSVNLSGEGELTDETRQALVEAHGS